jgi:hypothetical protein
MLFVQQNPDLTSQITEETVVFSLVQRMDMYNFPVFYAYNNLNYYSCMNYGVPPKSRTI